MHLFKIDLVSESTEHGLTGLDLIVQHGGREKRLIIIKSDVIDDSPE
jgi:hypothetical protein